MQHVDMCQIQCVDVPLKTPFVILKDHRWVIHRHYAGVSLAGINGIGTYWNTNKHLNNNIIYWAFFIGRYDNGVSIHIISTEIGAIPFNIITHIVWSDLYVILTIWQMCKIYQRSQLTGVLKASFNSLAEWMSIRL